MSFKFVALLPVLLIIGHVDAQIGQSCTMKITGARGVCKLTSSCPEAKKQASQGIRPTICGIDSNSLPIVCCEGAQADNIPQDVQPLSNTDQVVYPQDKNERISVRKCREYSALVSAQFEFLSLNIGATPSSVDVTQCDKDGIPLIVGGSPASLDEFPFMAALGYQDKDGIGWKCGGTLISDKYVMTAAHCTNTREFGPPIVVRLGELDLFSNDDGAHPIDYEIDQLINHPSYRGNLKYNDIALIKLRGTIKFSKSILPACLWSKESINQVEVQATGWGRVENGGDTSDILLKVGLNLLPKSTCQKSFQANRHIPQGISDSMLCAGELEGGKDTCQGDSGGPLVITKKGNQCVFFVVGVTSFGKICAAKNIPGVYTRVSSYVPWIERTIW